MLLSKEFTFEAAHYLPRYHGTCERLHGHSYQLLVTVEGEPDAEGMIIDFRDLKSLVKRNVIDRCDHHLLNDFIPNPSAELVAWWVWSQLEAHLSLAEIKVWETCESSVTLRRSDVETARVSSRVPMGFEMTDDDKKIRNHANWGCPRCTHEGEIS